MADQIQYQYSALEEGINAMKQTTDQLHQLTDELRQQTQGVLQSWNAAASQSYQPHTFDHTGQVAPPGMKPRVTATLWEDEGSLCFQVEAKGVCVARREGNGLLNPMYF